MIDIDNITAFYRAAEIQIPALDSFSLFIGEGDYVALLGPNGSGKSSLIRAICGLLWVSSGKVAINRSEVRFGKFGEDLFGKVGVVFQEPGGQFLMRDVRTEIGNVLENLGLPYDEQRERLKRLVEQFALSSILDSSPDTLSGGQMQLVNLACALASNPRILLLDEPTTFLDPHYRKILLDHLDRFVEDGGTVLHITQYPDEALRAKRVCVINRGQLVFEGTPDEAFFNGNLLSQNSLICPEKLSLSDPFGLDLSDLTALDSFFDKIKTGKTRQNQMGDRPKSPPIITANNLKFHYPDNDFEINIPRLDLNRGEVTGLIGPTGSGKTTLAFLLANLLHLIEGEIIFSGKPISSYDERVLRAKLATSWQLPDLTMIGPTVEEDIVFGLDNLGIKDIDIEAVFNQVGLTGFEKRIVDTLSGGEKRKLSLAGILATNPEFLILDEPEAFLDPSSQRDLAGIINRLKVEGKGILMIGHDLAFIGDLADRIICIKDGKIVFDKI
jgi:energy-coupling factor transport system ATP-binding protein